MKETDYIIGGHHLRITGNYAEAAAGLPGWERFRSTGGIPAANGRPTIRLTGEGPQSPTPGPGKEEARYAFASGATDCTFARAGKAYTFRMTAYGSPPLTLYCDPAAEGCTVTGNYSPHFLLFALWMAYGLLTAARQTVAVHASATVWQGKAVLFLGESGTGKSTHTRLWQEHIPGATLLNDDSPVVRIHDGIPWVYGSPWSGKTPCYRNERAKLAGIVRLSQAQHNHIRRLNTVEAFSALYPSCPPAFARDETLSGHICSTISQVLNRVPVYHLACLPEAAAAQLSFRTLFSSGHPVPPSAPEIP